MFAGLINRAQATVDNAIGQLVNRALIAVPFLVAVGFATAYGFLRLQREFDSETAALAMALGFSVIGLLSALIFGRRPRATAATGNDTVEQPTVADTENAEATTGPVLGPADKELLIAALSTAGPIALPSIVRVLMRNLPIVAALIALAFVMTRTAPADVAENSNEAASEPATA